MKFPYSNAHSPPALSVPIQISDISQSMRTTIRALIDTGADLSAIPQSVAEDLALSPREPIEVAGYDGYPTVRHTYFIRVALHDIFSENIKVIPTPNDEFLLGRDVLNKIIVTANGPERIFELIAQKTSDANLKD